MKVIFILFLIVLTFCCDAQETYDISMIGKNSKTVKNFIHQSHPTYKMLDDSLNKYNDKHLTFISKSEPKDSLGIIGYSFYFNVIDLCSSIRVITKEDSYDKIIR